MSANKQPFEKKYKEVLKLVRIGFTIKKACKRCGTNTVAFYSKITKEQKLIIQTEKAIKSMSGDYNYYSATSDLNSNNVIIMEDYV